jgi:hypothetical protein
MSLSAEELEQWASAYIEAQRHPDQVRQSDPHWWAIERFQNLQSVERAEDAWTAILEILSRNPPPDTLGILGAGALDDLIDSWGPSMIDRIERKAAANPSFRSLLSRVWRRSCTAEIWSRVQAACGTRRT